MANIKISELNELYNAQKDYGDYVPIVDTSANETKKISVQNLIPSNVEIIAVTDTAPVEYETGDKYYNTDENRIYTATSWGWENPQEPIKGILYVILENHTTYAYNGTTLVSVGGTSSGSPVGTVEIFAGSTAPTGYLICDGSAISRTFYSDLFAVIGTTYGMGDGSTTFNIPNLKGRVPAGYDSSQTEFDTLGETGGEKTHTMTIDELVPHNHKVYATQAKIGSNQTTINTVDNSSSSNWLSSTTGNGQPFNVMQPYIVLNYIIKAL